MGITNIPPELLMLATDDLSLVDFLAFRSTCHRARDVLESRFHKICLQDVGELTAIQWAAIRGYAKLIEIALANGAEIDAPLQGKVSLTRENDVNWSRGPGISDSIFWANQTAVTEAKDSKLRTPLFLAACFGHVAAIEVLLKERASMQCFGNMMTPLHMSAKKGNLGCMQAFVDARFDINARGIRDRTILHEAVFGGLEMMQYILQLEGGTNLVNARDNSRDTPLHYVMPPHICGLQRRLMVELLLQHGADIHAKNDREDTPAHASARMGHVGCLQLFINAGFDFNVRGKSGKTILHCAVDGGKEVVAYVLGLEGGRMIIDVENDQQLTPLKYASKFHYTEEAEVLLRLAADAEAKNNLEQNHHFTMSIIC